MIIVRKVYFVNVMLIVMINRVEMPMKKLRIIFIVLGILNTTNDVPATNVVLFDNNKLIA